MTHRVKIFFIILIVIITLGIVGGIVWLIPKPMDMEDALPAGALVYVKLSNIQEDWKKISSTKLWQNLSMIDWTYQESSHWPQEQRDMLALIGKKIFDPISMVALEQFFGRELAFAIFPSSAAALSPPLTEGKIQAQIEDFLSHFLIVTRLAEKTSLVEFLSQWLGLPGQDITHEVIPDGYTMHRVRLPQIDIPIIFVYVRDLLIIGLDETLVQQTIEVQRGQIRTLATDEHFQRSQKRVIRSAQMIGYLNLRQLFADINAAFDALVGPPPMAKETSLENGNPQGVDQQAAFVKTAWQQISRRFAGHDVIGLSGHWEDNNLGLKSDLYFDTTQLDPSQEKDYTCPSASNESLSFVPADVLGYQWSNCLNLALSWKELRREAAQTVITSEDILGLNVEQDIIPAFADKTGGYLRDIRLSPLFPIPDLLFFVEIQDMQKASNIVNKLDEQFASNVQRKDYNGIPIHYLVSIALKDVEPAYGIIGKYFLIALHRTTLEDAIDRHQGRLPSLATSQDFLRSVPRASGQNRFVQFVRVDGLIHKMEDIVQWLRAREEEQDALKDAFQSGSAKRLADMAQEIQDKKKELERLKEQAIVLGSQKEHIAQLEAEIASSEARQKELEKSHQGYDRHQAIREKRARRDKHFVQPLFKGLASIRQWGMNTILNDKAFESTVSLEVE